MRLHLPERTSVVAHEADGSEIRFEDGPGDVDVPDAVAAILTERGLAAPADEPAPRRTKKES